MNQIIDFWVSIRSSEWFPYVLMALLVVACVVEIGNAAIALKSQDNKKFKKVVFEVGLLVAGIALLVTTFK